MFGALKQFLNAFLPFCSIFLSSSPRPAAGSEGLPAGGFEQPCRVFCYVCVRVCVCVSADPALLHWHRHPMSKCLSNWRQLILSLHRFFSPSTYFLLQKCPFSPLNIAGFLLENYRFVAKLTFGAG